MKLYEYKSDINENVQVYVIRFGRAGLLVYQDVVYHL